MTATGHAVIGVIIAAKFQNPLIAIPIAVLSHLAADLVPHWDVATNSNKKTRSRLNFDTFLDVTASFPVAYLFIYFLFPETDLLYAFFMVLASQSFDWITGPYYFLGIHFPPFNWSYRFQKLFDRRLDKPWGIVNQILVILTLILLAKIF